jgi:hypothetical protein
MFHQAKWEMFQPEVDQKTTVSFQLEMTLKGKGRSD